MKLTVYLRDPRTLEKSQLLFEGDDVKVDKSIDDARRIVQKYRLDIVNWTLDMDKGETAQMGNEPCTSCGAPGMSTFNKVDRTLEGIVVSSIHLSLCQRCFHRFRDDPKERTRLLTLGLELAVIFPSRLGEPTP